jgi:hypothetical protein
MDALLSGRSTGLQKSESTGSSFAAPRFTLLLRHGSVDIAGWCNRVWGIGLTTTMGFLCCSAMKV